ncbi:hypothetical protein Tco_0944617 [Tanacetum coccineum]
MEKVHNSSLLLLIVFISFLNLTTFSVSRITKSVNQNAKSDDKGQKRMPVVDYTQIEYPPDPYGSLASMYFPAFAEERHEHGQKSVDGLKDGLASGGYGGYGGSPYGYGYDYPFPGGILGFPQGIFGFPRGIFSFPPGIFGFPGALGRFGGYPGGYGGGPGGGYGGGPGGGYGGGHAGGPGGYDGGKGPGYGVRAEAKSKKVNSHD